MYRYILVPALLVLVSCNFFGDSYTITHAGMQNSTALRWDEDSTVLVMAGNASLSTTTLRLSKGKYTLRFRAKGSPSSGIAPHFMINLGEYTIRNIFLSAGLNSYEFKFELPHDIEAPMQFVFDNDHRDSTGDRNIFLHYPIQIDAY